MRTVAINNDKLNANQPKYRKKSNQLLISSALRTFQRKAQIAVCRAINQALHSFTILSDSNLACAFSMPNLRRYFGTGNSLYARTTIDSTHLRVSCGFVDNVFALTIPKVPSMLHCVVRYSISVTVILV